MYDHVVRNGHASNAPEQVTGQKVDNVEGPPIPIPDSHLAVLKPSALKPASNQWAQNQCGVELT